MNNDRNGMGMGLFKFFVVLAVFIVATNLMFGVSGEQPAVPDAPPVSKRAQTPVANRTLDVCMSLEAAGNRKPGVSQRCAVDTAQGAPFYRLTLRGSYGDDEGLVIILLLHELARLDEAAGSAVPRVRVVRPDPDALFKGSTTVLMSAIRECGRKDDRLCMLDLIVRPD